VTPGEAEKLARLVSEHHKAVQLTEIEESLRDLKEALGLDEEGEPMVLWHESLVPSDHTSTPGGLRPPSTMLAA
jgi:hypothetical protein